MLKKTGKPLGTPQNKSAAKPVKKPAPKSRQDSIFLKTLMDRIPDTIYFKDTKSRLVRVNKAWLEKHQLSSSSQAIGKSDHDFFPKKFADETSRDEQMIMETGNPARKVEKYSINDDTRWYSSIKVPVTDESRKIIGTCGISRDITTVKQAEEVLEKTNAILEERVREKTENLRNANTLLEKQVQQLNFINDLSYTLSQMISVNDTCSAILAGFCKYFSPAEGGVFLRRDKEWKLNCQTKSMQTRQHSAFLEMLFSRYHEAGTTLLPEERELDDTESLSRPGFSAKTAFFMPLVVDEKAVGFLTVIVPVSTAEKMKKEWSFVRTLDSIAGVSLGKALQHAANRDNARYEGELLAARNIQRILVPDRHMEFPHALLDCAYRPALEVGGDYLDFFVNDLGHLVIAIGDVCGKGVPAALLMSILRTTVRIEARNISSARALLINVHELIKKELDVTSYISVSCCVINRDDATMSYARAGHPPMIRFTDAAAVGENFMLKGIALGMIDNTAVFTSELGERVIALEKGDRFFLFTDGLIETRVPDGSLFGTDRVKELLRGVGDKGPDAVVRLVEETVEECSEGRGPSDDMALLCFMIR